MKGVELIFILGFISLSSYGQNYIEYYQLCNEADKKMYFEEWQSALDNFEIAFELVDYVHAKQYEKASQCAVQIKEYEKAYAYAKSSILNSNENQFWKNKQFNEFRKSNSYERLMDSLEYFKRQSFASINWDYARKIDSLFFLDQTIFRNGNAKGDFKIDYSQLPQNTSVLDSMILASLLKLIDNYGFPSEQIIGVSGYEKALIIVHHNFRLKQNEKYHSIVWQALRNGKYLPRDFGAMYEQYHLEYKNQTFFTTFDKNLTKDNLARINANRLRFGLKDLSDFRIKRKGLSMIPKW